MVRITQSEIMMWLKLKDCIQGFLRLLAHKYGVESEVITNTPHRYMKAMQEILDGYDMNPDEILKDFEPAELADKEANVYETCEFYSLCEHHLLPFFGKVHIGYITKGRVFGLSKLARLVDVYAHRLQIQERLTTQIADALYEKLIEKSFTPEQIGVFVVVEAKHLCMIQRGIKKQDSRTVTKKYRGCFARGEDAHRLREEFLMILRSKKVKI